MRVLLENECLLVAGGDEEEKEEEEPSCEEKFLRASMLAGAAGGLVYAIGLVACKDSREDTSEAGGTYDSNYWNWIMNGRVGPRIYGMHELIVRTPYYDGSHTDDIYGR